MSSVATGVHPRSSNTSSPAAIVQLFSFIGIDVVHHSGHILLCQVIKTAPLGENPTDQFVVDLDCPFLVRTAGITVVDAGSA